MNNAEILHRSVTSAKEFFMDFLLVANKAGIVYSKNSRDKSVVSLRTDALFVYIAV